jgi:carbonic anhydrase
MYSAFCSGNVRLAAVLCGAVLAFPHARPVLAEDPPSPNHENKTLAISPEEALKRLREGNERFVERKSQHPHQAFEWRAELEAGQHPFAVILGCADSRVPPELLFDQGFGDLFVVRVAGNIVDTDVRGSIEYAVDHLGTPLVLVLGHTRCGAVTAALDHAADSPTEAEEIVSLLYRIEPALKGLSEIDDRETKLKEAVKRNVQLAVQRLTQTPDLIRSQKSGKLKIMGGVYDMHTGKIEFLEDGSRVARPALPAERPVPAP